MTRIWVGGFILIAVSLSGCSAPPSATGPSNSSWKDEIVAERLRSSGGAREVLEDGRISQEEYVGVVQGIRECLGALGVEAEWKEGAWHYTRPDGVAEASVDECIEREGGNVLTLKDAMERNPSHVDEDAAMAKCLARERLVPPGYSRDDYLRDLEAGSYTFDVDASGFARCVENPF